MIYEQNRNARSSIDRTTVFCENLAYTLVDKDNHMDRHIQRTGMDRLVV